MPGIAKSAGMNLIDIPFPSGNLRNDCLLQVKKLEDALPNCNVFLYIHIKDPDEQVMMAIFNLKRK